MFIGKVRKNNISWNISVAFLESCLSDKRAKWNQVTQRYKVNGNIRRRTLSQNPNLIMNYVVEGASLSGRLCKQKKPFVGGGEGGEGVLRLTLDIARKKRDVFVFIF